MQMKMACRVGIMQCIQIRSWNEMRDVISASPSSCGEPIVQYSSPLCDVCTGWGGGGVLFGAVLHRQLLLILSVTLTHIYF
jgi:hypothetical protein